MHAIDNVLGRLHAGHQDVQLQDAKLGISQLDVEVRQAHKKGLTRVAHKSGICAMVTRTWKRIMFSWFWAMAPGRRSATQDARDTYHE